MASNELIIDDEYCQAMGNYYVSQGQQIDQIISEYISILQDVRNRAIISGDVAKALTAYMSYANRLNKQIGNISTTAKKQVDAFLSKVDVADQYLF